MRLEGKICIITGAGSGIGEATAKTFAREGGTVVVAEIDKDSGERVATEINDAGGKAEFLQTDVEKPEDIERMINRAVDTYGRLDVLHNNAVWFEPGRVGDISLDGWRRSLDIGLTAYWYATKLALKPMVAQNKGSIVCTASVSGLAGDYGLGAYNVLKAGVVNLCRTTAIEYARKGVRANAICPGPIGTKPIGELHDAAPQIWESIREAIPMGRYGEPQEIANVALFLASDESGFCTGSFFVADGGLWAHSGMPPITGLGHDFATDAGDTLPSMTARA